MMRALLREPLAHFLAIGALVFAAYAMLAEAPPVVDKAQITVDAATIARLEASFRATWRRPPSPAEREHLVEAFIREEVLVREALALGLDQDDAVVRQRLRQKLDFLMQPAPETLEADEDRLRAYFEAKVDRYTEPPTLSFTQVFLGAAEPGLEVETLRDRLTAGADPAQAGETSQLRQRLPPSTARVVDAEFGLGFFDRLRDLPVGVWAGPVRSGYGFHMVRIEMAKPAKAPPFEEVRALVAGDWASDEAKRLADVRFNEMLQAYDVVRLDLDAEATQ